MRMSTFRASYIFLSSSWAVHCVILPVFSYSDIHSLFFASSPPRCRKHTEVRDNWWVCTCGRNGLSQWVTQGLLWVWGLWIRKEFIEQENLNTAPKWIGVSYSTSRQSTFKERQKQMRQAGDLSAEQRLCRQSCELIFDFSKLFFPVYIFRLMCW